MDHSEAERRVKVLETYGSAFRDLVNAKVWRRSDTIRQLMRLNKNDDWNSLCTAMDIVGDACEALVSFLRFGLDGPTKYTDVGEAYLRLYGILSATYIQQQAVLTLYKLVNVPNPSNAKAILDTLEIRSLRHKLGSHSTDYLNTTTKRLEAYAPVRMALGGFNCTYFNNETMRSRSVDMRRVVEEHCDALIALMDNIYEKAINTLFKGQAEKLAEFREKLADLRTQRDGGFVAQLPEGGKLVIRVLGPRNLLSLA